MSDIDIQVEERQEVRSENGVGYGSNRKDPPEGSSEPDVHGKRAESEGVDYGAIRSLQRRARLSLSTINGGRWENTDLRSRVDEKALAADAIGDKK